MDWIVLQNSQFDRQFDTEDEARAYAARCRRLYKGPFEVIKGDLLRCLQRYEDAFDA